MHYVCVNTECSLLFICVCVYVFAQEILTSSVFVIVAKIQVNGPAELEDIAPLIFIYNFVLGLLYANRNKTEAFLNTLIQYNTIHPLH